ncbi:exocyst complex component EXO70B1-like [Bidens hawaiensis]|uniref:exocyst complex component EXO70B1-like n=1 Tax=Bidens hawaiensis TaxID=980011 RepID=UPI004048ECF1
MTTDSSTQIIHRWNSTAHQNHFIFNDHREEIDSYLHAVDEIQRSISEDKRNETETTMRIAVSRLTDEFRNISKVNAKSTPNPNNTYTDTMTDTASDNNNNYLIHEDDYVNRNQLSADAVKDIQTIAVRMNSVGFIHEFVKVYVSERKSVIRAGLRDLNVERLSKTSCRRLEWGVLDSKIKMWIKAVKICYKYYFVTEKRLCEEIFHGLGDKKVDSCFMDVITDCNVELLDTAEAFACIRPASERLFGILGLHDTLFGIIPVVDNIFDSESSDFVKTKVVDQILPKLADKANEILLMFGSSLVNEQSPVVRGEPVHRLSKYVMRYVYELCDHKQTLVRLSVDAAGSLLLHVVWIIMSLASNLEVKSRLCDDEAASWFFVMNNFHYVIQKIQARPELMEVVADDSFNKLIDKFECARSEYLKLTFDVALKSLSDNGLNKIKILSFRVIKLADRLKRFNSEFERLENDLGKVVVADFGLVLELRKLIVEMVVTAYSSFLVHVKKIPRLEAYVKYSVEGIESAIQGFYDCK